MPIKQNETSPRAMTTSMREKPLKDAWLKRREEARGDMGVVIQFTIRLLSYISIDFYNQNLL